MCERDSFGRSVPFSYESGFLKSQDRHFARIVRHCFGSRIFWYPVTCSLYKLSKNCNIAAFTLTRTMKEANVCANVRPSFCNYFTFKRKVINMVCNVAFYSRCERLRVELWWHFSGDVLSSLLDIKELWNKTWSQMLNSFDVKKALQAKFLTKQLASANSWPTRQ